MASTKPDVPALIPGIALKFLRTGVMSGNIQAGQGLLPVPDFNFFSATLQNHVNLNLTATPKLQILGRRFCASGRCVSKLGVSNLCTHDQDGNEKKGNIRFPFKLRFVPGSKMTMDGSQPADMKDFLDRLKKAVPVGSELYTIYGMKDPKDTKGVELGTIVTTDECVTSLYGDTKLFFKHQGIDEDAKLMPKWAKAYDEGCTGLCDPYTVADA